MAEPASAILNTSTSVLQDSNIPPTCEIDCTPTVTAGAKRRHSTGIKPQSLLQDTIRSKTKRRSVTKKQCLPSDLELQLQPTKDHLSSIAYKYSLGFSELLQFLKDSFGKPNLAEVAKFLGLNESHLTNMLKDVSVLISERVTKSKILRLIKRMEKPNEKELVSTDEFSTDQET